MPKYLAAYAAAALSLMALDAVWIGYVARPLYTAGIGHLMADAPRVSAALAFYAVYALGLVVFAIAPARGQAGVSRSMLAGAAFGFFAYATYDLSNLATLRNWPIGPCPARHGMGLRDQRDQRDGGQGRTGPRRVELSACGLRGGRIHQRAGTICVRIRGAGPGVP